MAGPRGLKAGPDCAGVSNHTANGTASSTPTAPGAGPVEGIGEALFGEEFGGRILWSLVTFLLAWIIIKVGDRAFIRSAQRVARLRRLDDQRTRALVGRTKPARMTVRLLMMAAVAITLTGIWGLQTAFTGLLAGAGFAGIVIGLAAGDTIGDVIAGFLIFYNHPFDIGDWVEIDGTEGIIEDVQLGATTLITWDNEKVTIPNRLVEGQKIKNFSHARKLRRRLLVGVEYGSHIGKAMQVMVDLAKKHPEVLNEPEPTAVTIGFGQSSVDLQLRFYVEPVRSSAIAVYTDLLHQVHDTFRKQGIRIAFPHMQIVQGDSAFRVEGGGA